MRVLVDAAAGFLAGALLVLSASFAWTRVVDAPATRGVQVTNAPSSSALALRTLDAPPVDLELDRSRKQAPSDEPPRSSVFDVTFANLHTLERLGVGDEPADPTALARFLRCRVTYDETAIDVTPVEVARAMARRFGSRRVEVVSGFRSPKMNEMLRKKEREVAARSLHMEGAALDFRVPGVDARTLAAAVAETHEGGIGTYPVSNFVHVDTGANRRWRGR